MSLTRDELLVVLIEECAEVIQAATKCLRFGFDRNRNDVVLSEEIGDLFGIVDGLIGHLDATAIGNSRATKVMRAERANQFREKTK